jgi:hypothetical protein
LSSLDNIFVKKYKRFVIKLLGVDTKIVPSKDDNILNTARRSKLSRLRPYLASYDEMGVLKAK